jgi:pimeloyl-ACP methyl ester carboxylesterase
LKEPTLSLSAILAGALAFLVALVAISCIVEALRPVPERPDRLAWAPAVAVQYTDIGGTKVRYIRTGAGPNLVLLHTLRTQLDVFQGVIPELARQFTVYAYDYPGHGWSDVARASYAPEDFYKWTAAFLDALDIRQATVAGVSIGATIALVLAARNNPRVVRVVAVNSYDYGPAAGGVRNSSFTARLVLSFAEVPILGATIMRLRNRLILDRILRGGLAAPTALSEAFSKEFYEVGNRPGQYRGFLNLLAHEQLWLAARKEYPAIRVPVLLVYGEDDWAPPNERDRTRSLIPGVAMETVQNGNHFLPLDRPQELQQLIARFAAR